MPVDSQHFRPSVPAGSISSFLMPARSDRWCAGLTTRNQFTTAFCSATMPAGACQFAMVLTPFNGQQRHQLVPHLQSTS
jgi:hypothetical protein